MQKEINERTDGLSKRRPDRKSLSANERQELKELGQEQREIADMLDKLTAAMTEGDDP